MKKFLWKICPFILFILVLELAIPDGGGSRTMFFTGRQIRDNGVEPNSNYIKMEYVLHNPDKFDSFLFGSSRTGFVNVDRIPGGKMVQHVLFGGAAGGASGEPGGTMIEHGIIPKNVMVGVDNLSAFVDPDHAPEPVLPDSLSKRQNKLGFYANYFSIKGVLLSLEVILEHEPADPDYVERYYANGCTVRDPFPGRRLGRRDAPYWDDYYRDRMSYAIEDMKEIAALCEEYGINLIVFTNPIYYRTYQQSKFYGYDNFLFWLSGASGGGYYNFSGESAITMDRRYYYESSHYTEELGDMIIDRIFYGKTDESLESQGFGMYVTDDNIEEFKTALANH